jgi:hypothetical protein
VYWRSAGQDAVESVSVHGGPVASFGSEPNGALSVAVDATNLYWCADDGIFQQPLAGGPAITIGTGANAIAVDGTHVYYVASDVNGGSVARVPIGGGTPTVLATGRLDVVVAVAVDDRNVYWLEGEGTIAQGALAAMPKSGGNVTVLASGLSDPSALVVDDSGIYFNDFAAGGLIKEVPK